MGCAWERLLRTVKQSLKIIHKIESDFEFMTVSNEVERIVNSGSLNSVSDDPS